MFSFLFGAAKDRPVDTPVQEGHRGIDVIIDGKALQVDVDVLAEVSGLFLQVQSTSTNECPLEDFPGGIEVFRQIVSLLMKPEEEEAQLLVGDENILNFFEAAWLLECPRVFDAVMGSAYLRSLSSRRRAELLEYLLPFTAVSSPAEGLGALVECDLTNGTPPSEDFMRIFLLETKMWQRTEKAALDLVSQLDAGDFVLGPRLATGSLRVCCELLSLFCKRTDDAGLVTAALQPVSAMWKNLTDKPLRAKVCWDAHLFALQCIRKRLPVDSDGGLVGEQEEDKEAKADIEEDLVISVDDRVLMGLAELVQYVDIPRSPPNWAALLIRTLMLVHREEHARKAFVEAFPNSPRLRVLAWRRPTLLPASWLSHVATHVEASEVLLLVLSSYREMGAAEFCDIVEHVLLESFLTTSHCKLIVLASELVNEIVGACFDAGEKVRAPQPPPPRPLETGGLSTKKQISVVNRRCPDLWEGQHLLWRVAHLGTRLFEAAFVPQCGFLPHRWPDSASDGDPGDELNTKREFPCQLEPIVVKVAGNCLWDEGLLRIELLGPIMESGCAAPHEPILHFGQQVIMRHLWYHYDGAYFEVPRLVELWELARWPLCKDAQLVREALEYLKGVYRELRAEGACWAPEHEEALFRMFAALDLQLLPGQALLSPWIPPQAQAVRLLVQQQPAEQFHAELQQEVVTAMESLKSINLQCCKLSNKLNIVEQRTVINKSQINDSIAAIEELQRKKSQAAQPSRRMVQSLD